MFSYPLKTKKSRQVILWYILTNFCKLSTFQIRNVYNPPSLSYYKHVLNTLMWQDAVGGAYIRKREFI